LQLDSPLEQQERYIAYGSGVYFVIVIWLVFLQGSEVSLQNLTAPFTAMSGDVPDFLTIASLTAISFAIGYFIKYLGVHKWVDEKLFKFKKETDSYIISCLGIQFDKLRNSACSGKYQTPKRYELMDIFFEFIDIQDDSWAIQRALYFSYYTKYGLSMNLFVLSLFGIGIILGIFSYSRDIGIVGCWALLFFIAIGWAAVVLAQHKIRPEVLQYVTRPQIYRIVYDERAKLSKMLCNRFCTNFYRNEYSYEKHYGEKDHPSAYYRGDYMSSENLENDKKYNVIKLMRYYFLIAGLIILTGFVTIIAGANMYHDYMKAQENVIKCSTSNLDQWCNGTSQDDNLVGTVNSDFVNGQTGNDRIEGHAGIDTIEGNVGSDEISAGDGDDYMIGGSGDDNLNGNDGNDRLYGGMGLDEIEGGQGIDVIFQNNESNEPDGDADIINCGSGNDHAIIVSGEGDRAAADCENK
jgi:hypothetical protein